MTADHPEDWIEDVDAADVRRALERIDAEASEHPPDYAAGMRNARLIAEEELANR